MVLSPVLPLVPSIASIPYEPPEYLTTMSMNLDALVLGAEKLLVAAEAVKKLPFNHPLVSVIDTYLSILLLTEQPERMPDF